LGLWQTPAAPTLDAPKVTPRSELKVFYAPRSLVLAEIHAELLLITPDAWVGDFEVMVTNKALSRMSPQVGTAAVHVVVQTTATEMIEGCQTRINATSQRDVTGKPKPK